jgi:hypothetical protein
MSLRSEIGNADHEAEIAGLVALIEITERLETEGLQVRDAGRHTVL